MMHQYLLYTNCYMIFGRADADVYIDGVLADSLAGYTYDAVDR